MASKQERNHPSETLYKYPAGTIAHKARFGDSVNSKRPNEQGNLPDDQPYTDRQ
ncbi:hypothetical protein [Brevibacillus fulvus]|uniref:Uncharacterized protein n=1 Tax=Brevibacillus fulvus TaxID=1125967 RepID=A0A939BRT0_9BACL|nr:hypothetical protein [Brevibacillus fulvus]MBM7589967.1 hypothetical protein [Brevibacillus fulvus]